VAHAEAQQHPVVAHVEGQQHPIGIYLRSGDCCSFSARRLILLTTSTFQGYLRWFLIMPVHVAEGRADRCRLHAHALGAAGHGVCHFGPDGVWLMVLLGIGALEADYTFFTRGVFFVKGLLSVTDRMAASPSYCRTPFPYQKELPMTEKSYATNVLTILAISVVLMAFIFLLVGHHYGIPERVRLDRGALLGTGSSVTERIKPVAQVNVASAETQREPVKNTAAAPPASRTGQQVYQTTCVACHDAGIAGAPKLGDKGQRALAKGLTPLRAAPSGPCHPASARRRYRHRGTRRRWSGRPAARCG